MSKTLLWTLVIIVAVVFGPLVTIWGLNTLFPVLNIPYTFETWCATIVVQLAIRSNISTSK
jgi:hypothetical protein